MSGVFRRALAALLAVCLLGCAALAEEYEDYGEYYIEYEDPWEEEQEAITPLRVSLTPENGWVNVGGSGSYRLTVRGGVPPYATTLRVTFNGATISEESMEMWDDEAYDFTVNAGRVGTYKIRVSVTDWADQTAAKNASLAARQRETESKDNWEESMKDAQLCGDWAADLVEIARTQIGYQESEKDIRVDSEGKTQGYTRYGAWAGPAYAEWCAIFIGFCLHYAGVPETAFPWDASVQMWLSAAKEKGIFREPEGCEPQAGDVVFLRREGEKAAAHIGIVETAEGGEIGTIEGNANRAVARRNYAADSDRIAGYASMAAAEAIAQGQEAPQQETPAPEPAPAQTALTFRGTDGETVTAQLAPETELAVDLAGGAFVETPQIEWDYTDGRMFYAHPEQDFAVPDVAREGFEFDGWTLETDEKSLLTAQWQAEEEPIVF